MLKNQKTKRSDIISKSYIMLVLAIVMPFAMNGQSINADIDRMNDIKRNESFIYGEGTNANKDEAYNHALMNALSYAKDFCLENGIAHSITTDDIKPIIMQIIHYDGNQYDILVYIKRTQVLSMDDPSNSSNSPTTPDRQYKEPSMQNNLLNPSAPPVTDSERKVQPSSNVTNDVLYTLSSQDNWAEIKGFLSSFKDQGKIKETGICTNPSEAPIDSYKILIDKLYGILAIISPKNSNNSINLKTNKLDNEFNYPNCAVIVWFK